ncbi:MAG TPA: hypothetical protein VGI43_08195 [Mucilaginibacter sp.]
MTRRNGNIYFILVSEKILLRTLFFILLINICPEITIGQTSPLSIYTSKTLFHSIPATDKEGFTSFKFMKAQNAKDEYLFVIYKDHIDLKTTKHVTLKITKVENKYVDDITYFVRDPQNRYYSIEIPKDAFEGSYDISYSLLNKKGEFLSVTMIICKKLDKLR